MNFYTSTLEEYQFFKGDTFSIPFIANNEDGEMVDLSRYEVRLYLFPYGQYGMPVQFEENDYKKGVLSENSQQKNECTFNFVSKDTINLENNKYVYQPILFLLDNSFREFRRGEGIIIFKSSVKS